MSWPTICPVHAFPSKTQAAAAEGEEGAPTATQNLVDRHDTDTAKPGPGRGVGEAHDDPLKVVKPPFKSVAMQNEGETHETLVSAPDASTTTGEVHDDPS